MSTHQSITYKTPILFSISLLLCTFSILYKNMSKYLIILLWTSNNSNVNILLEVFYHEQSKVFSLKCFGCSVPCEKERDIIFTHSYFIILYSHYWFSPLAHYSVAVLTFQVYREQTTLRHYLLVFHWINPNPRYAAMHIL